MKKISVFICLLMALTVFSQTGKKSVKVFNGKLAILIPADVDSMSAEYMQYKYHKAPDGKSYFYCDKSAEFSIAIVPIQDNTKEEDMVKHKEELFNSFIAKGYKLEENTVRKINGHSLVMVSFYSDVPGGKVFNRRFFAVAGTQLIQVTFNAYGAGEKKRKQQIEESIHSVIIK